MRVAVRLIGRCDRLGRFEAALETAFERHGLTVPYCNLALSSDGPGVQVQVVSGSELIVFSVPTASLGDGSFNSIIDAGVGGSEQD